MASVGRLLLVLFLCASTAPALTSAQPIGFNDIQPIIEKANFIGIHDHSYRRYVVNTALELYGLNARHIAHLRWPEINGFTVPMGVEVAACVLRHIPILLYKVSVSTEVTGMFEDDGNEIPWLVINIFYAVERGQHPTVWSTIKKSLYVKFGYKSGN
ncbi:hypothetical protein AXF42_Ash007818 [Apostasia shenzhenica]|uniref:Uncharacterized protein n=1 Tax=Apostasia shenzhenica TaxID=1088818 RepID=A0A2I0B5G3_9ASPA|nr:hypothetical protein AXF42_Ash007818 [Apostasia shenzhenica]